MTSQFPLPAESFLDYFNIDLASTPQMRRQAEAVRYNVYCEEFGHEPPENFPDRREFDDYDDIALQLLVTHRKSRRAAGCVRLILASDRHRLPIEDHCINSLYIDHLQTLNEDRGRASEFSRLAVDAAFRRVPGEKNYNVADNAIAGCSEQEQRTFGLVGIASFLGAFALANIIDRSHLYAMMEATLPRLLRRSGISVQQAGATTEYHGQRSPFFITTDLALENIREDLHSLYEGIHEQLVASYQSCANVA